MKLNLKPYNPGMETAEFSAFVYRHNVRIMKIILGVFIVLDIVHYFQLGATPGGFLHERLSWLIPAVLSCGVLLGVWIFYKGEKANPLTEYVFITYILGSRILYGTLIGFHVSITAVYVGLMLLISSIFYLGRRIIYPLLLLQIILHLEALFGWLSPDTTITLIITDVFAVTAMRLSWERYRTRYQAYLMNKSNMEKNSELQAAYRKISEYNNQVEEQLKKTREAEALMKGLLENTEAALVLIDAKGDLKYYNDGLRGIIGYGFEEIDEHILHQILMEDSRSELNMVLAEVAEQKESQVLPVVRIRHKEGFSRVVRIKLNYIDIGGDGYTLISVTDITAEMNQQKQVEQLYRMKDVVLAINQRLNEDMNLDTFFNYVLSRVREVMPHADLGCILLLVDEENLAMAASFGYNQEESRNFRLPLKESFAHRVTDGNYSRTIIIDDVQKLLSPDYVDILENEENFVVQSSISGPIMKDNKLYGFINIDSNENHVYTENDVTIMEYLRTQLGLALSQRELFREHVYLSKHDQLSGFMNRWYLQEVENDLVPRWSRYAVNILVVAMDLNDLKKVNDRLGHHEGDAYIQSFSAFIKQAFRSTDILIRLGGDEFAGIFFHLTESELAAKLDEVNRKIADSELQQQVMDIKLGFGYGIVRFGEKTENMQELLQVADNLMYIHKAAMKAEKAGIPAQSKRSPETH